MSFPATQLDSFMRWNFVPPVLTKCSNIVYLITCRRCGLQNVGLVSRSPRRSQTLALQVLLRETNSGGHRSDITHRRTDVSPVAEHFNSSALGIGHDGHGD